MIARRCRAALAGLVLCSAAAASGHGLTTPVTAHAASSARIAATPQQQIYSLDCEAAALQIALSIVGVNLSQGWFINQIGADTRPPVMSGGRPVRWGDPYQTFVGDIRGSEAVTGYGVYYPPMVAAAQAGGVDAVGGEGWAPSQLYDAVAAGHPVVVWVPHLLRAGGVGQWTTWDGRQVWYSPADHVQVLIGFDYGAGTITLANPADGRIETFSMSLFETRFRAFQSSAIVISPRPPAVVHFGAIDPATSANSALAVGDSSTWALRPAGTGFGQPQQLSSTPFYGSRATLFANVDGPGHGASGVAVNDSNIFVMRNTGNALGPIQQWSNVPFYGTRATVMADVDGSGYASAVAINDSSIWVMLNNRQGGFGAPHLWSQGAFYGTRNTVMADIDGSGRAAAVALNDNSIWVMTNRGTGALDSPRQWSSAYFYGNRGTFMADMDGSGRSSPVAINDSSVWVMSNNGTGGVGAPTEWSNQLFYGTWVYMADVDGSHRASAIAVNRNTIWVEQNTGTALGPPTQWSGVAFYGDH